MIKKVGKFEYLRLLSYLLLKCRPSHRIEEGLWKYGIELWPGFHQNQRLSFFILKTQNAVKNNVYASQIENFELL